MFTQRSTRDLILAVDVGTTSIKAAVVDDALQVVTTAEAQTEVSSPHAGEREVDMDALGESVLAVLADALGDADPEAIVGIAITAQGDGAWLLDDAMRPVGPAILWNDARSADAFVAMRQAGEIDRIHRTTRGSVHPGSLPVIVRHLALHEPERLARVRHVVGCKDWIRYLLTGVLEAEASDAGRSYVDTETGAWDERLFDELGDLPASVAPPLADASETRPLLASIADRLGLRAGIPVGVGTMDVAAAGYAFCAAEAERTWVIVGTTSFVGVVRRSTTHAGGNWMPYGTPGLTINSLAPMIGTPLLEWVRRLLGHEDRDWAWFAEFAMAGAEADAPAPPLLLPYLAPSGERAPFVDPFARGSLHGLSYDTTPEAIAWSVFDGIASTIAECIDELDVGSAVRIAGGGSSSDLLCQRIADRSGRIVERPSLAAEAGLLGAARRMQDALGIAASSHVGADDATRFVPAPPAWQRDAGLDALRDVRAAERTTWPLLATRH